MFNTSIKKIVFVSFIMLLTVFGFAGNNSLKIALGGNKAIYRKTTNIKVVALTFDDGPDPRFTNSILDTLKKYNVPATFFMVGDNVKAHPEIAKRIVAEGHEVGDHTMTHPTLTDLTPEEAYNEIESGYQTIISTTGTVPLYFRSPKGLTTDYAQSAASSLGMKEILWTVTIENRNAPTSEEMANRVLNKIQPGYIILLHDGRLDRTKTVKALPLLLDGLKEKGYKVISLTDLLTINYQELAYYDPLSI